MGRKARTAFNRLLEPYGYEFQKTNRDDKPDLKAVLRYRERLTNSLGRKLDFRVVDGPFRGLKLISDGIWNPSDLGSKLFGLYEQEIFPSLETELNKKPDLIIICGAADGYYAVGIKTALPQTNLIAYEIDKSSQKSCERLAHMNGVSIDVRGAMNVEELCFEASKVKSGLIIVDVEGAEAQLGCSAIASRLSHVALLIECHEMFSQNVTQLLIDSFQHTHNIEEVHEAGRNPNRHDLLKELNSFDRAIICCEFRAGPQSWLYMTPRQPAS